METLLIILASFFVAGCGISIVTLVAMNMVEAIVEMRRKLEGA